MTTGVPRPGAAAGRSAAATTQVAIVVVTYEAESTIEELLGRIPDASESVRPRVLIADDCSSDRTVALARSWADAAPLDVDVVAREVNLGYGGNQKASFAWAADEGADVVVLLHGDAQYPPERIGDLLAPILSGDADFVFGSRMIDRGGARAGHMPLKKRIGNRVLSKLLNAMTGASLTEWFSGFRAYRTSSLVDVGLAGLPDGFDFDVAVTVALLDRGARVQEIAIPTRYAGEISRVPLVRTGLQVLRHGVAASRHRAQELAVTSPRPTS